METILIHVTRELRKLLIQREAVIDYLRQLDETIAFKRELGRTLGGA